MNRFCIAVFTILISTASSRSTSPTIEYNPDYYDDVPEDNNVIQNDKSVSQDSTIRPSFVTQPQVITAKEGESVRFNCLTKNAASDVKIWKKNSETIVSIGHYDKKEYDYVEENDTLIIKYVKQSSSGYYSCIILISTNDNVTLTHRLKVENAAEVTSLLVENNKTKLTTGDNLKLTCEAGGLPKPSIKWYFKGQDEEKSVPIESNEALRTADSETILIPSANMKNSGDYTCEASNGQSIDLQMIHIDVFDKGRLSASEESHSDSIVGGGSAHLLPSIALFITTLVLINQ